MFTAAKIPNSPTSIERPISTLTVALNKSPTPPAPPHADHLQASPAALLIATWKKASQPNDTSSPVYGSLSSEDESESMKMAYLAKKRFAERRTRIAANASHDAHSNVLPDPALKTQDSNATTPDEDSEIAGIFSLSM